MLNISCDQKADNAPIASLRTVLFLCDDPNELGGLQRVLATLIDEFRVQDCRVVVTSLYQRSPRGFVDSAVERVQLFQEGWLSRLLQRPRIGPLHLQGRRLLRLRKIAQWQAQRRLRKQVAVLRPDAVIIFDSLMAKLAGDARLIGTKVLVQYHNSYKSLAVTPDFDRLRRISGKVSAFLALTPEDAAAFRKAGFNRVSYVVNPVPFFPEALPRERPHRVVALGRYHHQKAFDHLVKAWALVSRKGEWNLDIYGDGPDRIALQNLVQALGVEESVTIHPPTWDAKAVLTNASIYALSSRFEGLPMVMIEAMACGLPMLCTRCGPGAEGLAEGCGLLSDVGDVPSLAANIQRLIDEPVLRQTLGVVSRDKAQAYRVSTIIKQWEDVVSAAPPVGLFTDV